MFKKFLKAVAVAVLGVASLLTPAVAQNTPIPSRAAQPTESHGLYSINLQDLSVNITLPVRSKPGFNAVYAGTVNKVVNFNGLIDPAALPNSPGYPVVNGVLGYSSQIFSTVTTAALCPNGTTATNKFSGWEFFDAYGALHTLPTADYIDNESVRGTGASCYHNTFSDQTLDKTLTVSISTNSSGTGTGTVYFNGGGHMATTLYMESGANYYYTPPFAFSSFTDAHGNVTSVNSDWTVWTDAMQGIAPLGMADNIYSWTDILGGTQQTTLNATSFTETTSYGCSGVVDYNAANTYFLTSVSFPDSTFSIAYEPNGTGATTGRISRLTLPTGGTVTFAYSGFNCNYLQTTQMTVTTADGTWTYAWAPITYGSGSSETYGNTTTVTDPAGNKTVYQFIGLSSSTSSRGQGYAQNAVLVQTQTFSTGSGSAAVTLGYCYNNVLTNCLSTAPSFPITRIDAYTTLAGMSTNQHTQTILDTYGNVTTEYVYDYNVVNYIKTVSTYAGCGQGSTIKNALCSSQTFYGSNQVSGRTNTYNATGNLLSSTAYDPANSTLTTTNTYNTNGTLATSQDSGGVTTTYTYGDCNGLALTNVARGVLSQSWTYGTAGCDGGVPDHFTDPNGVVTQYSYYNPNTGAADPYYRRVTTTNGLGDTTDELYESPTWHVSEFNFGSSTNYTSTYLDSYGRPTITQRETAPGSGLFDTVSTTYSQSTGSGLGAIKTVSAPCQVAANTNCLANLTTNTSDFLGRLVTAVSPTGATLTSTYTANDILAVLTPTTSGENSKSTLTETNGLGMGTIKCPVVISTLPTGTSCGGGFIAKNGYPQTTSVSATAGIITTTQTTGSQSHTQVFDSIGRLLSESYPESGTTTYTYDSATGCSGTMNGQLAKKVDAKGNVLCYAYDSVGHIATVSINGTFCNHYFYDNSTGFSGTIPTGITLANPYGNVIEAATSNCTGTLITDEWMSYDAIGRLKDAWELTPHSGGYYHATENYADNGTPVSEVFNGYYTENYTLDGEGRWYSGAIGAATEVLGVSYNAAGQSTIVTFPTGTASTTLTAAAVTHSGSPCGTQWGTQGCFEVASMTDLVVNGMVSIGCHTCGVGGMDDTEQIQIAYFQGGWVNTNSHFRHPHASGEPVVSTTNDYDSYAYDGDNRMTLYTIRSNESAGSMIGALTYNGNGTIASLAITDGFNSGGTATCNYTYDDLARLTQDICSPVGHNSTMSYDSYGNMTQASPNGSAPTWPIAGQSYSATTNRVSNSTYDANGSTLTDYFHTYTWDGFNRMSTIDSEGLTYDALGRIVETHPTGNSYQELWYSPTGTKVIMNGATWVLGHFPMPGGVMADFSTSATYIHHKDWRGSSPITTAAGAVYTDKLIAAYGNDTGIDFGPAVNFNFSGLSQDIETAVYDTPNREYMPYQGRWPNVDPSHSGWNGYAYPSNPLLQTDRSGLCSGPVGTGDCADNSGLNWDDLDSDYGFVPADNTDVGCPPEASACVYASPDPVATENSNSDAWLNALNAITGTVTAANNFTPWDRRASVVTLLRAKNDCSAWFNTGTGSAADVMSNVPILNISPHGNPNIPGPDAQTSPSPTTPIEVYTNGRFWPIQDSANGLLVGGVFPPGSSGAQTIILLHELAHKSALIPSDGNLNSPPQQSEKNTQTVMGHCAAAINE